MDARHLRHFIAVVEHGNMLRASEAVFVTQPALTKSVKSLEKELGVRLLDRFPHGVAPTIYGRQLYEHAKLIVNQLNRAENEIRSGVKGEWGHVRIGFGVNFAGDLFAEAVLKVLGNHPEVTASVVSRPFDEIVPMLRRGDLDLAVAVFPFDHRDPELVYEPLVIDEFKVVCRSEHPLVGSGPQPLKRLAREHWALFDRPSLIVSLFQSIFLDGDLQIPRTVVQTNSVYFLKSVLRRKDYLSYLPPAIVYEELKGGEFATLPTDLPLTQTKGGIIYRANDIIPAAALEVIDALRSGRDELELGAGGGRFVETAEAGKARSK